MNDLPPPFAPLAKLENVYRFSAEKPSRFSVFLLIRFRM